MGEKEKAVETFTTLLKGTGNDQLITMLSKEALAGNHTTKKPDPREEAFKADAQEKLEKLSQIPEFAWFMDKFILTNIMPTLQEADPNKILSYEPTSNEIAEFAVNKFCRILYFNTLLKARRAINK